MIAWCCARRDCHRDHMVSITHHPTSDKIQPNLSIQTSKDIAHKGYNNSTIKPLHAIKKHPISYHEIQCKILFENCAGHQVLQSFVKIVSETLSCDAYLIFEEKVRELQWEAFVGINTCNTVLTELQLGCFVKYKKIKDIKTTVKQWIIGYAAKGQPFLVAMYNRQTRLRLALALSIIWLWNHNC